MSIHFGDNAFTPPLQYKPLAATHFAAYSSDRSPTKTVDFGKKAEETKLELIKQAKAKTRGSTLDSLAQQYVAYIGLANYADSDRKRQFHRLINAIGTLNETKANHTPHWGWNDNPVKDCFRMLNAIAANGTVHTTYNPALLVMHHAEILKTLGDRNFFPQAKTADPSVIQWREETTKQVEMDLKRDLRKYANRDFAKILQATLKDAPISKELAQELQEAAAGNFKDWQGVY